MLEGVMRMADLTAGDVMVAAPRMDLINIDAPLRRLLQRGDRHRALALPGVRGRPREHHRHPAGQGPAQAAARARAEHPRAAAPGRLRAGEQGPERPAARVPRQPQPPGDRDRRIRPRRRPHHHRGRARADRRRDRGRIRHRRGRGRHLRPGRPHLPRQRRHRRSSASARPSASSLRRRRAERGLRHHRRPDRARDGPCAQARRAPRAGRPDFVVLHTKGGAVRWFKVSPVARRRRSGLDARRARRRRCRCASGASLAGLAQAASIAAPWNGQPQWWLQLLSLAVLAWRCCSAPARRLASAPRCCGWVFATAWLAGTFWWLFISMHVYGGLAAPLAALAVLALAGVPGPLLRRWPAACFVALAPAQAVRGALLFAALWLLAELLRGSWFTGFPWGAGGYAHVDGPLAALAPWLGVHGIGAVAAALLAFAAVAAARCRARAVLALLGAGAGAPGLLGRLQHGAAERRPRPSARPRCRSRCCRATSRRTRNSRAAPASPLALEWYGEQLQRRQGAAGGRARDRACRCCPQQLPAGLPGRAAQRASPAATQAALVGMPLGSLERGLHQLGARPAARRSRPYRYDKHHLVPFGEFIPPLSVVHRHDEHPAGRLQPRRRRRSRSFEWQGQRLAPNICYEDLFGEELGAQLRATRRRRPRSSSTSATSPGSATRWRSTSTCRSAACGRWSSRGRCCAPPTPAPR